VAQLLLVGLLIAVVVTAVAGSAHAARPANWTPFAPHGWLSVGRAASTLMLSFVGWEAVAPLTGRVRAGQLSRVIGIAFAVTATLYLGLAVATVSCLGRGADLSVPLADLLQLAVGPAGRAIAAAAALILTAGSVNAYLSGAAEMLRELTAVCSQGSQIRTNGVGHLPRPSVNVFLGFIALTGLALIALSALRLADIAVLVSVPTAMFLCVYLSCTLSATRLLTGKTRIAAAVAVLAVAGVLAFSGWTALLAAALAAAIAARPRLGISPSARWVAGCSHRILPFRSVGPATITLSRTDVISMRIRRLAPALAMVVATTGCASAATSTAAVASTTATRPRRRWPWTAWSVGTWSRSTGTRRRSTRRAWP
jgi:amino acid efflux transporter